MAHDASVQADGIVSARPVIASSSPRRRGIFAVVLAALHHSRRIQARRILRQYRHLISHGDHCYPFSTELEDRDHVDQ